jgi:glutamate N-acetyltransferase/amino-acid N-acetyltransferase
MIHPNMATMLGYLLTDVELTPTLAKECLSAVNEKSFNMISVDGDTSTNDAVFLLANGATGVKLETDGDLEAFRQALTSVAQLLAQSIARDGEGSTRLIEVSVAGVPDESLAKRAARGITVSPLFKAAVHGCDPNWGRILARLGAEGVPEGLLARTSLSIQDTEVLREGIPVAFDRDSVRKSLKRETVRIVINFASGSAQATAWGCDLSRRYVDINAEYST